MKILSSLTVLVALTFAAATSANGQQPELPKPGPEYAVLQSEVGKWNVEIKAFTGPGEPTVSKGKETNRMLGGFWLLSDFHGKMMGMDFMGHGVYGYDAEQKQYVGTWRDSLGPHKMDMTGTYDKASRTMTWEGMGPGSDGKPVKHLLTTKYNDDGTRVLTMHMQAGDAMVKIFEMNYSKVEER